MAKKKTQEVQEGYITSEEGALFKYYADTLAFNTDDATINAMDEKIDFVLSQKDADALNRLKMIMHERFKELFEFIDTHPTEMLAIDKLFTAGNELPPRMMELLADAPAFVNAVNDVISKNPKYKGLTFSTVISGEYDADGYPVNEDCRAIIERVEKLPLLKSQKEGRELRYQLKAEAENIGAVMELKEGTLPIFSKDTLWDAFAPGRISRLGNLSPDEIDRETGRVNKNPLQDGDVIMPKAAEISYKTFLLLNAIVANSVENFRTYFIADEPIRFYVKGVLDALDVDPRIRNDMQLNLDRKTAGVLYLEKQFEPLLTLIGTIPKVGRYTVLTYEGYDAKSDTMIIRTPYLYQLWELTQTDYARRKARRDDRIADGKKPLRQDLKPLEVNHLFKNTAYKEDNAVLEIAAYITNTMLRAGRGNRNTEIAFKTLINNCPRLKEKLTDIDSLPKSEKLNNGKVRNNTARYNTELRKIAKAYSLIMDKDKCDALQYFKFTEFSPTKKTNDGRVEFVAPTKSTLNGKIIIKWKTIKDK